MMHLHLVFIGKTSFPEIDTAIARYLERLRHYVPMEVHVVRQEKIGPKTPESTVRDREGEKVLRLLGEGGCLAVWDQHGRQMDSVEFSRFLERLRNEGTEHLWMVIGGPLGISESLSRRARFVLSLSKMTLPHDMARLVVTEQLYRAFSILKGEPYHK